MRLQTNPSPSPTPNHSPNPNPNPNLHPNQLCINFTNERLLQLCLHDAFVATRAAYAAEGVPHASIAPPPLLQDNAECVNMLQGRLFPLLTEVLPPPPSTSLHLLPSPSTSSHFPPPPTVSPPPPPPCFHSHPPSISIHLPSFSVSIHPSTPPPPSTFLHHPPSRRASLSDLPARSRGAPKGRRRPVAAAGRLRPRAHRRQVLRVGARERGGRAVTAAALPDRISAALVRGVRHPPLL